MSRLVSIVGSGIMAWILGMVPVWNLGTTWEVFYAGRRSSSMGKRISAIGTCILYRIYRERFLRIYTTILSNIAAMVEQRT